MTDYDPTKWNSACDLLQEMVMRPHPDMRDVIRDELCCQELNVARAEVLRFIKGLRK